MPPWWAGYPRPQGDRCRCWDPRKQTAVSESRGGGPRTFCEIELCRVCFHSKIVSKRRAT